MNLSDCKLCFENRYGHGPVPGEGNKKFAKVCFLGRNPGRDEDQFGRPFIGRAGKRLDRGIVNAGLLRRECYITNVAKCMTPSNIAPSAECWHRCADMWLIPELEELRELRLIVTLGNQALQYFEPLGRVGMLHGTHFNMGEPWLVRPDVEIFVSYHPSAALRSTKMNEHFMADMQKLKELVLQLDLGTAT